MPGSKLLLIFIVLSVAVVGIRADGVDPDVAEDLAPLKFELEHLKTKIAALESSVAEGERQLKGRDESILLLESIIKEKTETVALLQNQIDSLQLKGAADAAQLLGKAHARAAEFEKQLEELTNDIDSRKEKQDTLEARAVKAEREVIELNSKLQNLQSVSDEQKRRIKKTERALKVAEEELMKVRLDASSRKKLLNDIEGAWLPPWLADRLVQYQAATGAQWKKHGKPAFDNLVQKVSEISSATQKKAGPHLETAKTKWVPLVKERFTTLASSIEPHIRSTAAKAADLYETSLKPHLLKAQEAADPYFQDAKKFSKPYIDRAATLSKPHVEKVRLVLKPYTKKTLRLYRKSLKTATAYHRQIQSVVKENLRKHELTRALATDELVWLLLPWRCPFSWPSRSWRQSSGSRREEGRHRMLIADPNVDTPISRAHKVPSPSVKALDVFQGGAGMKVKWVVHPNLVV